MFLSRTIVGLGEKRREMGTSARNQLVMNPKSTIWGFKHLIGRSFSDPFIKRERQGLPYDVVETGRDGLGIKVGAIDNLETPQLTFSVAFVNSPPPPPPNVMFASPQVLISLRCSPASGTRWRSSPDLLSRASHGHVPHIPQESSRELPGEASRRLRHFCETTPIATPTSVEDHLFSPQVPSFYTDRQRRALLDASTIAGLTCLRLMNDTTAGIGGSLAHCSFFP